MPVGPWLLAEKVIPLIEKGVLVYGSEQAFAQAIGFTDGRKLYSIRNESKYVNFDTVDKLLVTLNEEYLWHFPSSEGGFEDLLIERRDIYHTCNGCGISVKEFDPNCNICRMRVASRARRKARRSPTN